MIRISDLFRPQCPMFSVCLPYTCIYSLFLFVLLLSFLLYLLANKDRQGRESYSYNVGLIESHTWSIEPRIFQWPWRTPYQCQLNRLQAVMNSAGRLICGLSKFDHISQVLHDRLHWLTVPQRIRYKLCLLVYKALHGLAPQYLTDFCQHVFSVSGRSGLWSSTRVSGDLIVVSTSTNLGRWMRWSFAVSAPAACNQLSPAAIIHQESSVAGFFQMKSRLKTHLFNCNWHDKASL